MGLLDIKNAPEEREDIMEYYILKELLDIERELVIGDEKGQAPKTLKRITALTESLVIKINRDEEKQMISNTIKNCRF